MELHLFLFLRSFSSLLYNFCWYLWELTFSQAISTIFHHGKKIEVCTLIICVCVYFLSMKFPILSDFTFCLCCIDKALYPVNNFCFILFCNVIIVIADILGFFLPFLFFWFWRIVINLYVLNKSIVYSFLCSVLINIFWYSVFLKPFFFLGNVLFHGFNKVLYLVGKLTVFALCLSLFVSIL